jgi:hypothetical protein
VAAGTSEAESNAATSAAIVHAIGLVIMGATKRLRLLRQDGDALMREYIESMVVNVSQRARRPTGT